MIIEISGKDVVEGFLDLIKICLLITIGYLMGRWQAIKETEEEYIERFKKQGLIKNE